VTDPGRAAVLAIDGGGSKTDVALIGSDGSVIATVRGPGSNQDITGPETALAILRDLVSAVASKAGLAAGEIIATHTSACLAGADLPEEEAELGGVVQAQGWSESSTVLNDTYAVLRAGLNDDGSHWGVGVVCGQGTNCVAVAPDGRTSRFPALGQISGDWGGGGDLGPEALWWAVRAEDGRGPETSLRAAVAAHFGVSRVEDVVIGLHFGKIQYAALHGLVPVLFEVAGSGDQAARDVLIRQAEEIFLMVEVAARRLGLTDPQVRGGQPVPVVLGGSLMTARDPLLTGAITERVTARIPDAMIRIVDVPPVAGAALLGLDHVGAPPSAAARLRESARATW
jgi:N-acetylglucosamine kinase-like BadF-type ATPase